MPRGAVEDSETHECEACGGPATECAFSPEDGDLWFCEPCITALRAEEPASGLPAVREPDEATIRALALERASEMLEWCADWRAGMFTPARTDDGWTVEMYGLVDSAERISASLLSAEAEVAVLTARLDTIEAALPDTFYEGRTVDERVARIVDIWRRAISALDEETIEKAALTARLEAAEIDRDEAREGQSRDATLAMRLANEKCIALNRVDRLTARLTEAKRGLTAILIRCEEGDKRTDWLPTIASIARAALAGERGDRHREDGGLQSRPCESGQA